MADVDFSPDGKLLLTASSDRTAKLWATGTWREMATLTGHKEGLQRAAFAPDGRTVATAGDDRLVKLWHVATGRELATLHPGTSIGHLRFSLDGRMLCAGSLTRSLVLWPAPTLAEIDRALATPSGLGRTNP